MPFTRKSLLNVIGFKYPAFLRFRANNQGKIILSARQGIAYAASMAMNWEKNRSASMWRSSERAGRESEAAIGRVSATPTRLASARQIDYLQALLEKAGRRAYTPEEVSSLTANIASRLIKAFTTK